MRTVPGLWVCAGLCLAAGLCAPARFSRAEASHGGSNRDQIQELSGHFPEKPSMAPAWSIPVDPLGFAAPGPLYLGERNALVSLDFIDESRLLFTFRVPALLHRVPGQDQSEEREIRAVVLDLPSGVVEAQRTWTVHDRGRYLWMLPNGHFLLRDRDNLIEGDASLQLRPLLHFPGRLLAMELDPTGQYLTTDSREPAKTGTTASSSGAAAKPGNGGDPDDESADSNATPDIVVRVMDLHSNRVLLVSRARVLIRLPINAEGYLASLRGKGVDWDVTMNSFTGGDRILGTVKSACMPDLSFLSPTEILATACTDTGDDALVAMTTGGQKRWIDLTSDRSIWPRLAMSPDGRRFAREMLYVSHGVNALNPVGSDDIKGQWVRVFDVATGRVVFESPATPILDAGGNMAISPSGRRVAVLNAGAIQVFELPPAVPEPDAAAAPAHHP